MKFRFLFAWFDCWVGLYYDVGHRTLYVNPLPMCVFRFEFSGPKDDSKHRQDRIRKIEMSDELKKGDRILYLGYVDAIVLRRAGKKFGSPMVDIKALPNGSPKRVRQKECKKI